MILPTSVEPVKATLLTPGCLTRASPAVSPKPGTMLMTPAGIPGLDGQLAHAEGGQGGLLGGLEDDGAAGRQRGAPLPGDHEHREVPGDDLPGDAHRLAAGVAEVPAADRDRLAVDLVGPAGIIAEAVDHQRQVAVAALADRLAVVEGLELGQLVDVAPRSGRRACSCSRPRSRASILRQGPESNALRAALTARSMSAASPSATSAMTSSVAGLIVGERLAALAVAPLAVDQHLGLELVGGPIPCSGLLACMRRGCHDASVLPCRCAGDPILADRCPILPLSKPSAIL